MLTKTEPTKRQQEILDFITSHIGRNGFPPTITEIQQNFSFRSPNAVEEHLKALVRKGRIRRHQNKSRGLEVIHSAKNEQVESNTVPVPLVGRISAGFPVLAQENIETTIVIDKSLVHRSKELFALHVHGSSMIKAGIYDGDIVIARQQSIAENGDVVIALLGDETTIKRFFRRNGAITLQPENDTMRPLKVLPMDNFRILGKVVVSLRRIGD